MTLRPASPEEHVRERLAAMGQPAHPGKYVVCPAYLAGPYQSDARVAETVAVADANCPQPNHAVVVIS